MCESPACKAENSKEREGQSSNTKAAQETVPSNNIHVGWRRAEWMNKKINKNVFSIQKSIVCYTEATLLTLYITAL